MRLRSEKNPQLWSNPPERWQDYHIDSVEIDQQESVRDVTSAIIGMIGGMEPLRENVLYGPTPITSGPAAYRLVTEGKLNSIYEIYDHPELLNAVIDENVEEGKSDASNFRNSKARELFTDEPIYINPVSVEAIQWRKKQLAKETGNQKVKYEEKAFMAIWTAVIANVIGCMVQKTAEKSPWWQSTGGIQEFGMATFIEAGLWKCRPNADIQIIDRDTGRYVNLYERALKISETVKADIEAGHPSGMKLTTLVRIFSVHEMLCNNDPDIELANKNIYSYPADKMRELMAEMLPLLHKCQHESKIIDTTDLCINLDGKWQSHVRNSLQTQKEIGGGK